MINLRLTPKQLHVVTALVKEAMAVEVEKVEKTSWPERDHHLANATRLDSIASAIERAAVERIEEIKRGDA